MKRAALAVSSAILLAFVSACSPAKLPGEGSASSRLDENRFIPHTLSEDPGPSSVSGPAKFQPAKIPAIKEKPLPLLLYHRQLRQLRLLRLPCP